MDSALATIFGNRTAAKLMLYLFHHGEAYATGAARDLGMSLSPVQRQLDKFEGGGLLVSKLLGNTRVYSFNAKLPVTRRLKDLVQIYYEAIPLAERERLFPTRRRPRRRGKPVLGHVR